MRLTRTQKIKGSTQARIMNMGSSSKTRSTASTVSTFFNPVKKKLFKKSRGTNALYRAISAEDWELVVSICQMKPYKAEKWHDAVGFFDAHRSSRILPLHQACIFHPSREAIRHIIQAYPYALRSKENGYGRVPLHIACHSNASYECIHDLLSHYPGATIERDLIGRVPLHYALSNGATYEIVEELIKAAEQTCGQKANGRWEVCSVVDLNGWLPIHVACFMGAPAKVMSLLVKCYPEGVDAKTRKDSTPSSLLKGISLSPVKRSELETILSRKKQPVKYNARISPARTDIDKVVRMCDETCSKGVTLEIDEDETSSLSSMEGTVATVRTGTTKNRIPPAKRQLQFGADVRKLDSALSPSSPSGAPLPLKRSFSHSIPNRRPLPITKSSTFGHSHNHTHTYTGGNTSTLLLPTHSVYGGNPNIITDMSESTTNGNANTNTNLTTRTIPEMDVMIPPNDKPIRRSMMNRVRSGTGTGSMSISMSKSSVSTGSSMNEIVVFQPINSTAVFC